MLQDSVISPREVAAFREFMLDEDSSVHVMRDHPGHSIGILGGTWAVNLNRSQIRSQMLESFKSILKDKLAFHPRNRSGPDQTLLTRYLQISSYFFK